MGDMPLTHRNWLVSPDYEVEKKHLEVQIQERKSRIARLKQEIEDILLGIKVGKEADILMLEKELRLLQDRLRALNPKDFNAPDDVIEVNEQ